MVVSFPSLRVVPVLKHGERLGFMSYTPAVPVLTKAFEWLSCEKGYLAAASL